MTRGLYIESGLCAMTHVFYAEMNLSLENVNVFVPIKAAVDDSAHAVHLLRVWKLAPLFLSRSQLLKACAPTLDHLCQIGGNRLIGTWLLWLLHTMVVRILHHLHQCRICHRCISCSACKKQWPCRCPYGLRVFCMDCWW